MHKKGRSKFKLWNLYCTHLHDSHGEKKPQYFIDKWNTWEKSFGNTVNGTCSVILIPFYINTIE